MSLLDRIDVLRKVIDILPVGVWIVDQAGKIVYGNPAGQRIWGSASQGTNALPQYKGWWVGSGKRIASEEWAVVRAIRSGDISVNEELEIESADGSRKTILNSALPIPDAEGRVAGAIMVHHDITERKRVEDQLRGMVDRDPLTNAYNRRALYDFLEGEIHRLRRHGGSLSVIMFDVDHFKDINDDHGHVAGDRVLVAITELVREELRGLDRLARYSGEEFLIIAPNTTGQRASTLAERLRARIGSASFDTVARVTCSFGVCEYNGDDDADALVRRADDLMYRARRAGGRNGLVAE
ncbi:MAG: sensor domain-containing diguanylate cyclase [Betaproteobacteria bacterium]